MPTRRVRIPFEVVKESAKRNSCQVTMRTKTAVATMPGRASGTTMSMKVRSGLAPSMAAASSSVRGTRRRKPRSIQIATGSVTVM